MPTATALLFLVLPGTFTVDDDGPADFVQIADAVAAAQPGDVLLIHPGSYLPFALDKELSLLGQPGGARPQVAGTSTVTGAAGFALMRLAFERLEVSQVAQRGRIDDCTIGPPGAALPAEPVLDVELCAELLITRTSCQGLYGTAGDGGNAVGVRDSVVCLTDSSVQGGNCDSSFDSGGAGLLAWTSTLTLGGTSVVGGYGGPGTFGPGGPGGNALQLTDCSADLRGGSGDVVTGGWADVGSLYGLAVHANNSLVSWSGLLMGSMATQGTGAVYELSPPRPYLLVRGLDGPGQVRRILVYGTPGHLVLVAVGTGTAPFAGPAPGGWPESIWLDPVQLLSLTPLVANGQDVAASLDLPMPAAPGLEGTAVVAQALVLGPDFADASVTNPGNAIQTW